MKRNNTFERQLDLSGDDLHAYRNLLDAFYEATSEKEQKAIGFAIAKLVTLGQVKKEMRIANESTIEEMH